MESTGQNGQKTALERENNRTEKIRFIVAALVILIVALLAIDIRDNWNRSGASLAATLGDPTIHATAQGVATTATHLGTTPAAEFIYPSIISKQIGADLFQIAGRLHLNTDPPGVDSFFYVQIQAKPSCPDYSTNACWTTTAGPTITPPDQ